MNIREYCKSIEFEVIGNLRRMRDYDGAFCYQDEAMNEYLVDRQTGFITIITEDGSVL